MGWRPPGHAQAVRLSTPVDRRRRSGVEANARLTALTGVVLAVLLAVEGITILRVGPLLTLHVFVGMLLVPPVLLKMGSTLWRFGRYYLGSPEYRRRGPPAPLLRALGPVVVALTVAVFASGIALVLGPSSWRSSMLLLHQASFVVWFGAAALHVLGHLSDTLRLAPADFLARTRREVRGAGARQWALAASVVMGAGLGALVVPHVGGWLHAGGLG
jgi:hypothetical protein